jgi:hypothetical protein
LFSFLLFFSSCSLCPLAPPQRGPTACSDLKRFRSNKFRVRRYAEPTSPVFGLSSAARLQNTIWAGPLPSPQGECRASGSVRITSEKGPTHSTCSGVNERGVWPCQSVAPVADPRATNQLAASISDFRQRRKL